MKLAAIDNSSVLPVELLINIVEDHILSLEDYIIFSSVCRSWHVASYTCNKATLKNNWIHHQMPWLMLTDGNEAEIDIDDDLEDYCPQGNDNFDNLGENIMNIPNDYTRYMLNFRFNRNKRYNFNLPELYGCACWGSPYGWVVTLSLDRQMQLFNPVTKTCLPLPSQGTFPGSWWRAKDKSIRDSFISKAVLVRVPSVNDSCVWLVVTIYGCNTRVAIAKPGDKTWLPLSWDINRVNDEEDDVLQTHVMALDDAIYCQSIRSLLFSDVEGGLFYCDLSDIEHPQRLKRYAVGPPNQGVTLAQNKNVPRKWSTTYIVESRGNIIVMIKDISIIRQSVSSYAYNTTNFRVYKLDDSTKSVVELQDLQGCAFFVGSNTSFSVSPRVAGCRSNCIYFCDDLRSWYTSTKDKVGGHDMGVYSLEDDTVQFLYEGSQSRSSYCCPFWFSPSL